MIAAPRQIRPGDRVAILDGHRAPMIGTFLGLDPLGRAQVRRAIGGTWAGDLDQVIA